MGHCEQKDKVEKRDQDSKMRDDRYQERRRSLEAAEEGAKKTMMETLVGSLLLCAGYHLGFRVRKSGA